MIRVIYKDGQVLDYPKGSNTFFSGNQEEIMITEKVPDLFYRILGVVQTENILKVEHE